MCSIRISNLEESFRSRGETRIFQILSLIYLIILIRNVLEKQRIINNNLKFNKFIFNFNLCQYKFLYNLQKSKSTLRIFRHWFWRSWEELLIQLIILTAANWRLWYQVNLLYYVFFSKYNIKFHTFYALINFLCESLCNTHAWIYLQLCTLSSSPHQNICRNARLESQQKTHH